MALSWPFAARSRPISTRSESPFCAGRRLGINFTATLPSRRPDGGDSFQRRYADESAEAQPKEANTTRHQTRAMFAIIDLEWPACQSGEDRFRIRAASNELVAEHGLDVRE